MRGIACVCVRACKCLFVHPCMHECMRDITYNYTVTSYFLILSVLLPCIYVGVCSCVRACVRLYIGPSVRVYVCRYVCMRPSVRVYVSMYVCMCVCMYEYVCVRVYACTYVHV